MQFGQVSEEKVREVLGQITAADLVYVEDSDEQRKIHLTYHEVESEEKLVKTPLGPAKVTVDTERELSEEECREKFGELDPDEVYKTSFNNGDEYEVVLVYED